MTAASASTSPGLLLSFARPLPDDFSRPRLGRVGARGRGKSAALRVASTSEAGHVAFAPPPGAIGYRTLWAMLLGLFVMHVLGSIVSLIWT